MIGCDLKESRAHPDLQQLSLRHVELQFGIYEWMDAKQISPLTVFAELAVAGTCSSKRSSQNVCRSLWAGLCCKGRREIDFFMGCLHCRTVCRCVVGNFRA